MFEHVRAQLRGQFTNANQHGYVSAALKALYTTLTEAGSICHPFHRGDEHLYVRCDGMPFRSVKTVEFLASSNFLTCRITAMNRSVELDGEIHAIPTPYINIFKEPKS